MTWVLASAMAMEFRVGVGMPDLAHVKVGVPVSGRWSVHAQVGSNLGLITYFGASLGGRWDAAVRERGPRRLVLGVGPDVWGGPTNEVVAVIVNASVELAWSYDLGPAYLIVASRIGLGPTIEVPFDRFRLEPAGLIAPLQIGVGF